MSRAEIDRTIAPISFGQASGDRWDLIDPAKIATTCSPRHVQSVLEDASTTVHQLVAALRATIASLQAVAGRLDPVDVGAMETIRRASIVMMHARGGATQTGQLVELLTWTPCAGNQKPDADVDVMLGWGDGSAGAVGAWMGDHWIGPEGEPLEPPPVYWADQPTGPRLPTRPADPA